MTVFFESFAIFGGAIANIVDNALQTNPSYSSYFLSALVMILGVAVFYFAVDAVILVFKV